MARSHPLPKYYLIKTALLAQIEAGSLTPGTRAPSERELSEQYGVSRMTARQALNELETEGLLSREQGKGSFITSSRIEEDAQVLMGFSEDMRSRGFLPTSEVLRRELRAAPAKVARQLGIEEGQSVIFLERLRFADALPMSLEQTWLPAARFSGLLEHDLSGSVYELLRRLYQTELLEATQNMTAASASPEEALLLGIGAGDPLILVQRCSRGVGGIPLEFVMASFRADRYSFTTTLCRT